MLKNVTMAQIAKRVGVTSSAVSVVLSGKKSTIGVSVKTREKILKTAQSLGFKPNIFGRSLVSRRSFSIALLCRECFAAQILEILKGIQNVTNERDYSLLTFYHGDTVEDEALHLHRSLEKRVDGIIVMPALDPDGRTNQNEFLNLQKHGIPVVQVLMDTLAGIPFVMADRYGSGRNACRHLLDLGHRRIAYLTFEGFDDTTIPAYFREAAEQAHGYRDTMKDAGLEPVVITHPLPPAPTDETPMAYVRYGEAFAPRILEHPKRPTAVITFNGYEAFGLLKGFWLRGIRVPEAMSVVGVNTPEMHNIMFSHIPLTAFVAPLVHIGQKAASLIFDALEGRPVKDVTLEQKFVVRSSTGPPRES